MMWEKHWTSIVKLDLAIQCSSQSLCDHGDVYIHSKETIRVLREGQFKLQGKQTEEIKR